MRKNSEHESKEHQQENEANQRDMQRKPEKKVANLGVPTPGQGANSKQDAHPDDDARADSGGQDSYEPEGGKTKQLPPGSMPGPGPH